MALLTAVPLIAVATTAQSQAVAEPLPAAATALTEVVKARFGKHLTEEQLQSVGQSLRRVLANAERLKRVPLRNGDEPGVIFQADLP